MILKKINRFFIVASIIIALLLVCILGYVIVPFWYNGTFSVAKYEYADLEEIIVNKDLSNTKNVGEIKNAFDAYKKTDKFLKEEKIETIEKGLLYTVQFDKENNIWKIYTKYKYSLLDGLLYEGLSVFITADGYVLAVVHGG